MLTRSTSLSIRLSTHHIRLSTPSICLSTRALGWPLAFQLIVLVVLSVGLFITDRNYPFL